MNGQKFSLSFSKKIEKKALQPSALRGEGPAEGQKAGQAQALLAVDKDSLKVNEHVEEKDQLVIPLLEAKRSAVLSRLAKLHQEDGEEEKKKEEPSQEVQEDDKPLTLEEKAERALLEETKKKLGEWSSRDGKKDITIPATVTDDPLAAPLVDIGKESSLEDYDEIAVESYGAAILRGMGWKKSEGIGGRKKMVVDIINPSARNLGSSEGKESGTKKEVKEEGEEEEDLPIVKGSFVYLHSGRHRGTYGVVEVVDEDHLLIKAAVGQAILREVEANLRVATQKEYKESARVINKEMYDKFKEAEIKKNEAKKKAREEEESRDKGKERNSSRDKDSDKQNERLREGMKEKQRDKEKEREGGSERHREREADKHREREKHREQDRERHREREGERQRDKDENRHRKQEEEAERQKYKESKRDTENARDERREKDRERNKDEHRKDKYARHYQDTESSGVKRKKEGSPEAQKKTKIKEQKVMVPPWVRENLRVRLINKNYKGGKYYKEKVVVVSVVTAECCECKAEGGRLLGNIDPAWLETVIPKQPPMVVMVVRGPHNGQKGRILQLHKEQEKASIQLLEDETTILKLHYDDICEYILR